MNTNDLVGISRAEGITGLGRYQLYALAKRTPGLAFDVAGRTRFDVKALKALAQPRPICPFASEAGRASNQSAA